MVPWRDRAGRVSALKLVVLVALAGPAVNVAIAALLLPLMFAYGAARSFSSLSDYMHLLDETSFGGMLAS